MSRPRQSSARRSTRLGAGDNGFSVRQLAPAPLSSVSARLRLLFVVPALSLPTQRALAAGTVEAPPRYLTYVAPSECPSAAEYLSRVEQRLGRDWESALRGFAERVEVTLTSRPGRYDGTVEFATKRGEHFTRSVSGRFCSEVVDGISLMTAIAVRSPENNERPQATDPNRSSDSPDRSDSLARPPKPESLPVAPSPSSLALRPTPMPKPRESTRLGLRIGARLSLSSGVGPGAALGVGASSALELGKSVVSIGADISSASDVRANDARADFRLTAARLEGCPRFIELGRWVTFEPCVLAELGAFRAAARVAPPRVTVSEPATVSWGALGVVGRFVLRLRPTFAELGFFGRAPLRRERFYVGAEEQVVFRIPAVSGGVQAGLGLEF